MAHTNSVQTLTSLFRAHNEARPILLLGAGASFSSGVPLAAESVRRLAKRVFAERIMGGAVLPEQVKLTEWQAWLQSHSWFIPGEERLAENFPLVVEHLLQPREFRARLLRELVQPSAGIGTGYRRLAELVMRGLARTILTTNFDTCLLAALNDLRAHIPYVAEVNRGPDDLRELDLYSRAQIVWLHGKAEQYTDRNLLSEVNKLDSKLVRALTPLLASSPLIVVGYRGAELSIVEHLLSKNASNTQKYKKGVFWCRVGTEPLHPNVEAFRRRIGPNFRLLEIDDFDSLLVGLGDALAGEDLYAGSTRAGRVEESTLFDDKPLVGVTVADLDQDLMLSVMRTYCAQLKRAPVTAATLAGLLREQGLLCRVGDEDVPTNGCYLLFARNPQALFPHAVVSATVNGKKRTVFSGNLIQQRTQLLEWLQDQEVNPLLRVKRRSTHEQKPAYAQRALVELLVNLLVHRDYAVQELAAIDVQSTKAITFTNPGGLPQAIAVRVAVDSDGRFRPVPNVTFLRNRSLCDVFFGLQAMEREGTGLVDVERMALETGGATVFTNDSRSNSFLARIEQPASSAGSTSIARDYRVTDTYVLNVLPIRAMPDRVSHVRLRRTLRERPTGISLEGLGTFVAPGLDLWSFAPLDLLIDRLAPIVDRSSSEAPARSAIEDDADFKRLLSWLVRKHFETHLMSLTDQGLLLEDGAQKGRRAYFGGRDGRARTLVYDTPRRKGIARQVVKQRFEGPRAWFENEGFGYEVTRLDDLWGVRIKPFYMFTGRDAVTPLPAFSRTSRATRRMKFDRNKNVEDDLTFWSRFLGRGAPTINIGGSNVDDLVVESAFLTVDVAEEGLVINEAHNRVSA